MTSATRADGAIPALATRLRAELDPAQVIDDRQELRTYECDGLAQYKVIPALVALPHSAAEVAAVVRACAEAACRSWPAARVPACPAVRCRTPTAS